MVLRTMKTSPSTRPITLGKTEDVPFFLTGGKIYAPFGDFSTNMIQIRSPSPWARSTARV